MTSRIAGLIVYIETQHPHTILRGSVYLVVFSGNWVVLLSKYLFKTLGPCPIVMSNADLTPDLGR